MRDGGAPSPDGDSTWVQESDWGLWIWVRKRGFRELDDAAPVAPRTHAVGLECMEPNLPAGDSMALWTRPEKKTSTHEAYPGGSPPAERLPEQTSPYPKGQRGNAAPHGPGEARLEGTEPR